MKQALVIALTSLTLFTGVALADDRERGVQELRKADEHVRKAIEILNRARNDNRLDKKGDGEDALNMLRRVRSRLDDAVDNIQHQK
jgi:hypothetical protein